MVETAKKERSSFRGVGKEKTKKKIDGTKLKVHLCSVRRAGGGKGKVF